MNELAKTAQKYPSMRIGQLIINATSRKDLFFLENDELAELLKEYR